MHRSTLLPENWWDAASGAWAEDAARQDAVTLRAEIDQLRRTLAGRAVIDQACGMVMILAPCRRGPARNLLVDMERQCNASLPDVSSAMIAAWEGEPLPRLMQRALRHALRRLYAEDRGCDSPPAETGRP
ncbi:ANTAR domain-containing protein [Streptomyces canus]|uniref:ANTAR domain-containing protein n=1 Tax=Streptomyces canus TaxID=58343 RepID=UPI0033A5E692